MGTPTTFVICLILALEPTIAGIGMQTAQPTKTTPSMSSPMANGEFVMMAGHAGNTEVALSDLAASHSSSQAVKTAALKISADHKAAGAELMGIARSKNITTPDDKELGPDGDNARLQMEKLTGANFDTMWIAHMIEDHRKAIDLFTAQTKSTDMEIRAFAAKTLPALREHLAMVQKLKAS